MSLQITGEVKQVFPTETKGSFSYRMLWLTTDKNTNYPQTIEIQFSQGKASLLDGLKEGDNVTISINLKGRSWVNPQNVEKVFNTIEGWKCERSTASTPAPSDNLAAAQGGPNGTDDDLPF